MGFYDTTEQPRTHGHRLKTAYPRLDFVESGLRYYNSAIGRWPSRDPIQEVGGRNLYAFLVNRVVSYIDRLGLQVWEDTVLSDKSKSLIEALGAVDLGKGFIFVGPPSDWCLHLHPQDTSVEDDPECKTCVTKQKWTCSTRYRCKPAWTEGTIISTMWNPANATEADKAIFAAVYKLLMAHELEHRKIMLEYQAKLDKTFHGTGKGCTKDDACRRAERMAEAWHAKYLLQVQADADQAQKAWDKKDYEERAKLLNKYLKEQGVDYEFVPPK